MSLMLTKPHKDKYGVTALDGVPVVSTRKVAKVFSKEHRDVLESVRNAINTTVNFDAEFSAANFRESKFKVRGREYPEYLLTRDGFSYVVMGFTGERAARFKVAYIKRFNEMERFIQNLNIARLEYPALTDAIKMMHDEPKFYHFSNEADLINRIVLGMSAAQFRKMHGLSKGESIRPYLTAWQAEAIQKLQKVDVGLVVAMPDFQQRKQALTDYFNRISGTKVLSGG